MIYKNKTRLVPSIEKLIKLLNAHNIDMILCGSEAGNIYGLCSSTKDIDFILNEEINNKKRMFFMFKEFFDISSFEDFKEIKRIKIITLDKKHIEFFTSIEKDIIGITEDFQNIKDRSRKIKFYDSDINVVDIKDYITMIQNYKIYLESLMLDQYTDKIQKYNDIIMSYKKSCLL